MLFKIYKFSTSFPGVVNLTSRLLSTSNTMCAKVAVVLSGSGVYDGSEIHEASMCLTHLSRAGATVSMFAPDKPQMHVINHLDGSEIKPDRNCLVESARIARGKIQPLSKLNSSDHDAVILPGGFGAAKNLCDWAVKNVDCVVDSDVDRVLKSFNKDKKPIGLTCIAPVLAAKCIPGVTVTVGHATEEGGKWPYAGTASAIESCGAKHVEHAVTEAYVDTENNVVTTPAFMCEAPLHEIYDGIGEFVTKVLGQIKS